MLVLFQVDDRIHLNTNHRQVSTFYSNECAQCIIAYCLNQYTLLLLSKIDHDEIKIHYEFKIRFCIYISVIVIYYDFEN